MSKASVKRSPAKRASKNAVAEEPFLLEATLQKSRPLQREKKRASADFEVFASKSKAPTKVAKVSSIPTISASKLEGRQVVEQPMYMQQVLSIAKGISKELDQQQEQLAKVEVQLQQKRDVSLKNEGLSSAYSGLYTELEELKKELEHLKNSRDATPRDIDCKELEVQAITKVLAKVGACSESLNMKQDLDALQEKRDALEDEAKLLIAQQAFMDKATKFIQREGRASMVPTPPTTASTLKPIAFVGGSCAACGKPLSANHMAGVFLLTCQHKYHPFCFAVLCATSTGCSHPNCKEKILEIAKCWALGTAYTELGETKDGSCYLDSYDEDHLDRSNSFQMKGTASDDIANVLQGMAKPSGKMDNASTLVVDKDKNSTVDPPINFSIDVPPVHEGEDHEKNTTLDPVSKVSIDSAEGDHGKDKIVDPASKLSADNLEESEAIDDMDDPELGETLRFMVAHMKKKRKRELEEGPANPNRSTKPAHPKARACKNL
ncbi:hypothetical protein L7F22_022226 [Adiantum nelumboides]|nr:hypothetical protein [Adiantum nelumboides]